jgi:hypothetical protein
VLTALKKSVSTFYNYTGSEKCTSKNAAGISLADQMSYEYLECTETPQPMSYSGDSESMFYAMPFNEKANQDTCKQFFGSNYKTNYHWFTDFLGIKNATNIMEELKDKEYSKIIFSYGDKDPWGASGITKSIPEK